MNHKESVKLNAYHAVVRQFRQGADAAALETIPALKMAMNQFVTLVDRLDGTAAVQEEGSNPESLTKREARSHLATLTGSLADQLFAWAGQAGEIAIKEQANVTVSQLQHLKDAVLPARAETILQLATTHQAALPPYGFTEDQLSALAAAISHFKEGVAAPRNKIARRSAGGKTMDSDFAAAGTLMKEQFKKLMPRLKTAFPDVYNAFITNSKVIQVYAPGKNAAKAKRSTATERAVARKEEPET